MKREFLELLDKDIEFRYAVAGYLGLSEILKRLDTLTEEQTRLAEEQVRHGVDIKAIMEEQKRLAEEQKRLAEEQKRLAEEQKRLAEEQKRLAEEQVRHGVDIKAVMEEQTKIWEEIQKLREDFNRGFKQLDARLSRVELTLEKITLDIEEEARIVVKYRLRDLGYDIEVGSLILPDMEINLYGASDELCVVGEASVRASSGAVDKINRNIERLRTLYPNKLRPKIVKIVYTSLALPDMLERAEKEGFWVLKATGDIVKPRDLG
ncbi:MAG: hypothetical protein QW486_05410 [Candidatus Bathyarchaeia archaeon]